MLNLEVTVEPDLLHGYREIPVVSFQEQIGLGGLRSGVPRDPYQNHPLLGFSMKTDPGLTNSRS